MTDHRKILGWTTIAVNGAGLLAACISFGVPGVSPVSGSLMSVPLIGPAFLLILFGCMLAGLVGGLGLLRFHGWSRPVLTVLSLLALLLIPVGTALGAYGLWVLWSRRSGVRSDLWAPELRRRAALMADPVKRKYVQWMERGSHWSDEMIAYDMDPDRVVTCEHLQRVERAMRAAGTRMRLQNGVYANAECVIDLPALGHMHGPAVAAMYQEMHIIDRSIHDPKTALLGCEACADSRIFVIHPENAAPHTPRFPS